MNIDTVCVFVHCHAKTDRAILVSDDGDEELAEWLPLSQLGNEADDLEPGDVGDIEIPTWLAEDASLV